MLISILQLAAYALLDKFKLNKGKYLVLAMLFILYLFVLPHIIFRKLPMVSLGVACRI